MEQSTAVENYLVRNCFTTDREITARASAFTELKELSNLDVETSSHQPLADVISAVRHLSNISCLEQIHEFLRAKEKRSLTQAMADIKAAGRCLTRYLEKNGGMDYLKAIDPLKYLYNGTAVNVAESSTRRQSPGLISGGQGPKEFI